jgi:hypothetical protein
VQPTVHPSEDELGVGVAVAVCPQLLGQEGRQVHRADAGRGFGWAEFQLAAHLVQRAELRVDVDVVGAENPIHNRDLRLLRL